MTTWAPLWRVAPPVFGVLSLHRVRVEVELSGVPDAAWLSLLHPDQVRGWVTRDSGREDWVVQPVLSRNVLTFELPHGAEEYAVTGLDKCIDTANAVYSTRIIPRLGELQEIADRLPSPGPPSDPSGDV